MAKDKSNDTHQTIDQTAIAAAVAEQVLQTLGVSKSNSPRPTSGGSVQVTSDDVQNTVRKYSPRKGPKATIDELRAIREEAATKVTSPNKK